MRIWIFLGCLTIFLGCGSTVDVKQDVAVIPPLDTSSLLVVFPEDQPFLFLGKQDPNSVSGSQRNNMLYPGYNAGSFLAGVLLHGFIQGGVNASAERKQQDLANQVLDQYQLAIDEKRTAVRDVDSWFSPPEGTNIAAPAVLESNNVLVADVKPVFFLTQDERTVILSAEVEFYASLYPVGESQSVLLEYVGDSLQEGEPYNIWSSNDFSTFNSQIDLLLSGGINVALKSYMGQLKELEGQNVSIRYIEAGKKKLERGRIIEETCDRYVFLTLRDVIKSVPKFEVCESHLVDTV